MSEFKHLYDDFKPEHYQIYLDINRETKRFEGKVTVTGEAFATDLAFHQKDLAITAVVVNGQTVAFSLDEDEETVNFQISAPSKLTVAFTYSAALTDNMTGIYPSYYEVCGVKKQLVGTQFETHFARQAFPAIDEPAAKATFDLSVKFDEQDGELIVSNMPEISNENGIHTFETTVKMSAYLLAFVLGDLQSKLGQTKNGTKVGVFATKAHKPQALDFPLDIAIRVIEFYESYFNVAYPLPHSWHIGLPDFSAGAMENWGCITYREVALLADPDNSTLATRQYVALVIAHELAHQWFGDLVTMQWWDDLWLNESFANMMEYVAIDSIEPNWHIWEQFSTAEATMALNRDAIDGVQSVHVAVNHPDEINTLFDGAIVYAKGARLMVMLRKWLGDTDFSAGLHTYFDKHQYGNTVGRDLWEALSKTSGRDVSAFMTSWIDQPGYPVLSVSVEKDTLVLRQQQFFTGEGVDKQRLWQIPLNSNWTGLPDVLSKAEVRLPNFAKLSAENGDKPLLFNAQNAAHYLVKYSTDLNEKIVSKIDSFDHITKVQLIQSALKLAEGGLSDYADLVELLATFDNESSNVVNTAMTQALNALKIFVDESSESEKNFKTFVGNLFEKQYKRLGWDKIAGESFNDEQLRALPISWEIYAENADALTQSSALFAKHKADIHSIPADSRPLVLKNEITENETADLVRQYFEAYAKTTDQKFQRELNLAVSSTKKMATVDYILSQYRKTALIKPQDLRFWFASLIRREFSQAKAFKWLTENWEWVQEKLGGDMASGDFIEFIGNVFDTADKLNEFTKFTDSFKDEPAFKRLIEMAKTEITSKIALLGAQKEKVQIALSSEIENVPKKV
ncbi:aminopeptidase N [Lactococcus hodotermopsidis]|uniref:Aminopeptidase n=1 Tax=Pseudolactococcus hodotermopsidis TaxID=2709157 RepID=A0A6A0BFS1_9LACT|nr:M1 family metallopeptidase [Lactococcus hodotermopsidis]GFH43334.1 aminopeptidase N [Lactococcus hodotermopsidis]